MLFIIDLYPFFFFFVVTSATIDFNLHMVSSQPVKSCFFSCEDFAPVCLCCLSIVWMNKSPSHFCHHHVIMQTFLQPFQLLDSCVLFQECFWGPLQKAETNTQPTTSIRLEDCCFDMNRTHLAEMRYCKKRKKPHQLQLLKLFFLSFCADTDSREVWTNKMVTSLLPVLSTPASSLMPSLPLFLDNKQNSQNSSLSFNYGPILTLPIPA